MRITERDWEQLESRPARPRQDRPPLYPGSPHDIFIAVQHPDGRRMLTLRIGNAGSERRTAPAAFAPAHPRARDAVRGGGR